MMDDARYIMPALYFSNIIREKIGGGGGGGGIKGIKDVA